jgi:hypothetical protein
MHYCLEKIMTVETKELMFDDQYLVELTDAELSEINGGYAALVAGSTGDFGLAAQASGIVFGRLAFDQSVIDQQVAIGVPGDLIAQGVVLALTQGGGVYTVPVTAAKLGG